MTQSIPPDARSEETASPQASPPQRGSRRNIYLLAMAVSIIGGSYLLWHFSDRLIELSKAVFGVVADRHELSVWLETMGPWAPALFIGIQILQVIFAPVPGEATGIIGGFLFGIWPGFAYSSIGLACGSWINLSIGRLLGERVARRFIPDRQMARFDGVIDRDGVWAATILFIIPGFPKDYLCIALGISHIPLWLLLLIASVGRMPGTLMLSIQGAALGDRQWILLTIITAVVILALLLSFRYRATIARWTRRQMERPPVDR